MSASTPLSQSKKLDSLASRLMLILAVMTGAGVLVGGCGILLMGTGWFEALLGWLLCTFVAILAHVGGEYPKGDFNFAARMAIQMLVRTLPPFAVALWGVKFAEPPLETSLVFYILSFYLFGLLVDVQLHVWRLSAAVADNSVKV